MAAQTPCRHPACTRRSPGPYCEEHTAWAEEQANAVRQRADKRRGTSHSRGYGSRKWKALRLQVLRRDPKCTCDNKGCSCGGHCRSWSSDAAHRVAKVAGGADTMENVRGLCHSCHSYETATQDGGYGRRPAGPGGPG